MLHFFYTPYQFTKGLYGRYESANAEIVKYASKYLNSFVPTHISNFNSSRVTDRAEDILLGHPTWDAAFDSSHGNYNVINDWVKDNALAAGQISHPNTYIRHVLLVSDAMTMSGKVLGVSRYGIVKEKPSVLARASFETPIKHIINASMIGETDELNSVIENVMVNQPVPIGTGLPGLITKINGSDKGKKKVK